MDKTKEYRDFFPLTAADNDAKYGKTNWKAVKNEEPGGSQYNIILKEPEKLKIPYKSFIAITDKTGFVWLELNEEQAAFCIVGKLFDVFVRYEDESESLVEDLKDFIYYKEEGLRFYLEVGYIDPDFFKMQG